MALDEAAAAIAVREQDGLGTGSVRVRTGADDERVLEVHHFQTGTVRQGDSPAGEAVLYRGADGAGQGEVQSREVGEDSGQDPPAAFPGARGPDRAGRVRVQLAVAAVSVEIAQNEDRVRLRCVDEFMRGSLQASEGEQAQRLAVQLEDVAGRLEDPSLVHRLRYRPMDFTSASMLRNGNPLSIST
jgi:hypothetical protein